MRKLKEFRNYLILVKFLEDFFLFLSIFIVSITLCVFLKINFFFSFFSLFSFFHFLYFLKNLNNFKIAREIERKIPELDEKILTYLEFKDSEKERERMVAEKLEKFLENFDFKKAYPFSNILIKIKAFIYSLMYSLLLFSLFPYKFAEYYVGVSDSIFYLKIQPLKGTFFVPSSLNIKGIQFGERKFDKVFIEYKINKDKKIELMRKVNNYFTYSINIFEPCVLKYKIKAKGFESREAEIKFKERPFLKSWKVFLLRDTLYSPEKIFTFDSKFKILFDFSGDFDSGYIFINEEPIKKFYKKNFEFSFEGKEGFLNFVYFTDDKNTQEIQRIEIRKFLDEKPLIYVIFPPSDDKINEDMKIPFILYLMDDFSLKNLDLFFEFKENYSKRIKNYKNQKEDTVFYLLDLSHLSLLPGDTIRLWFSVEDRGLDGSSRVSKSRIYKFWVPTYLEIYKETEKEMEEGISFLKGEGKEVSDFYRDLKNIQEKIENLKEKKEFREIKEVIEEMEKSVEEMSRRFEEYSKKVSELLKRYPLDVELQEKLFELKELFNEIMTPELKKILEDIKEAIKKIDPEKLKEAYKNLVLNQEILKEQIERMKEFLEKVRQEIKLKELIERMKKMEEKMEGMIKDMEKISLSEFENLKEEMKNLSKDMEEISKSFKDEEKKIGEEIEEAKEEMEFANKDLETSKDMFSKGEKTCRGKMSSSKEHVRKAREKTEEALSNLLSMRNRISQEKLDEIFFSSLFLSENQGILTKKIEKKENIEDLEEEVFKNKETIRRFKDKVSEIAKINFMFPKKILNYVFSAHYKSEELYEKIKIFEFKDLKNISEEIENYLNLVSLEILKIKEEGQGGVSSALMEALKRLSDIIKEQSHINELTQSILPLEIGEAPSEEVLRSIERIAGMQKSLAEKLKEMLEELKGSEGTEELQGKLERIVEEMKKVSEEIEKGEVKREIVERQERILSRMLEIQRSVYKREFTQKRYAERPKPYTPMPSPKEIIEEDKIIKINLIKVLNSNIPYEDKKIFIDYLNSLLK